jgi:hypothetical protein
MRDDLEGEEPSGGGDLQFMDRVANLLLPAVEEIVKSHAWEAETSVLQPAGRPRSGLRESKPTVTGAARWRAQRAKRAIRALQIAGLWPVK